MWQRLGEFVTRRWQIVLSIWVVLVVLSSGVMGGWINRLGIFPHYVPRWEDVVKDGEMIFLPPDMPSLQAERLFAEAFPRDLLASSVVVVVRHESKHLDEEDRAFIQDVLVPRLEELQKEPDSLVAQIRTFDDPQIGPLLLSKDKKAALVIVGLRTEFLEHKNQTVIRQIEELIDPEKGTLRRQVPAGVHLSISGTATVGRDMMKAAADSASDTEFWTVTLVIGLLLIIYRAPMLALIPLITVFIAVHISLALIVVLTAFVPALGFQPFDGLKIYITVVAYGAGVDYCLFLIARYKEELDNGFNYQDSIVLTLRHVGAALTASAATVACGIGMMVFADFGKFRQAGMGMSLSLVIMLCASLTFTPALLQLFGSAAFWPRGRRSERLTNEAGWISSTSVLARWLDRNNVGRAWERIGALLLKYPGRIWLACVLVMTPFAVWGLVHQEDLSYGLISELPPSRPSVVGTKAVQAHFPAGNTGPLTVLLHNKNVDFLSPEALNAIEELTQRLEARSEELGIAEIRSVSQPMGKDHPVSILKRGVARRYYVSQAEEYKGQVTRIDIISEKDPFARDSVAQLDQIEAAVKAELPDLIREEAGTRLYVYGTTASMRDVRKVTDHDQIVINSLVLLVVYLILVVLLRKPAISGYLILSVFFSYFVSLGFTHLAFYLRDPAEFSGIDWKVPMFLFTILIAVGEDYNIFLMARIDEEQREHGPVQGVRVALQQTGSIISSCGIIMAGTFFSLVLAGSLAGMQQLGFALAFGVLLDTYVVRPLLVPAYLIMLHSGWFGPFGRLLGSMAPAASSLPLERVKDETHV